MNLGADFGRIFLNNYETKGDKLLTLNALNAQLSDCQKEHNKEGKWRSYVCEESFALPSDLYNKLLISFV